MSLRSVFLLSLIAVVCTSSHQKMKHLEMISSVKNPYVQKHKASAVLVTAGNECGSGLIISADGLILTAYHMVEDHLDKDDIYITNYKSTKKYKAEVISFLNIELSDLMRFDFDSDIALLKIISSDTLFAYSGLDRVSLVEGSDFVFWGYPLCGTERKKVPSILKGHIVDFFTQTFYFDPLGKPDTLIFHPMKISGYINPGSSGSGIIDFYDGKIVGMVLASRVKYPDILGDTLMSIDSTLIPIEKLMPVSGMGYAVSLEPVLYLVNLFVKDGIGIRYDEKRKIKKVINFRDVGN